VLVGSSGLALLGVLSWYTGGVALSRCLGLSSPPEDVVAVVSVLLDFEGVLSIAVPAVVLSELPFVGDAWALVMSRCPVVAVVVPRDVVRFALASLPASTCVVVNRVLLSSVWLSGALV